MECQVWGIDRESSKSGGWWLGGMPRMVLGVTGESWKEGGEGVPGWVVDEESMVREKWEQKKWGCRSTDKKNGGNVGGLSEKLR